MLAETNEFDENGKENLPVEPTLEDEAYLQYLINNYPTLGSDYLDRVRDSLKPPKKSSDPDIVQIGVYKIEVQPYIFPRIKQILKDYFGNPEKGGYDLKRIYEYKYGRYPGQEVHYEIIDNETKKIVIPCTTLRTIRVILSGIARTGFPLEDMYDQIFEFRLMSWQEHGFPLFPAEKDLLKY